MSFSLSCTALVGTNKAGTLKPDTDGYYQVVLGALDVYNNTGAFYPEATARQLFQASSSLMRRIASGNLRGEYGHPTPEPGMSMDAFVARVRRIDEDRICMHIRKVWIDYSFKNLQGQPIIAILGEVRPSGPRGPALKDQLENRFEDVCFSIRSLTHDFNSGGRLTKNFKMIVTWDYVNEPGLDVARKWNSPAMENLKEPVLAKQLEERFIMPFQIANMAKTQGPNMLGMESNGGVSLEEMAEVMSEVEKETTPPAWMNW
jgi:hypothetical protein